MRKKDSFPGQVMIVLPEKVITDCNKNNLTNGAFVTDIGYYPQAKDHYRQRSQGSIQNILIYCVEGSGWISVNGKKTVVRKNQFFIIPKNTPHTYAANNKNPWSIYWIHFGGDRAEQLIFSTGNTEQFRSANEDLKEDRIKLFKSVFSSLGAEYSRSNLEYTSIVLMYLLGSFVYEMQFGRISEEGNNDVVQKAISYMKENLNQKLQLDSIAEFCNLSVSHFCLVFKKNTSHTPVEYHNNLRIQQACQLLDFTSMKIKEISNQLGFSDAYYFSKVFSNVIGEPPRSYRKHKSG